MFDSKCVIQGSSLAFALSGFLTTFLARRGKDDEDKASFFFSYLTLTRQAIALIGTVVHLALISKDTASSTQNVALLSVRIFLNLTCLIYHYYWSLGKGWYCLNTLSVQWRYNTILVATLIVAFFGGLGLWAIYHQGIGEVVVQNLLTVFLVGWILKQGFKDILQGCVFKLVRDTISIASSMLLISGILNLVEHNIPRATINLPNSFIAFLVAITAHFIHKKEELPRLIRIDTIQVSSSNPVPPTKITKHPLQKSVSTTNR